LIFSKYVKYQKKKTELAELQTSEKSGMGIYGILALVIVVAATTYYFTRPGTTAPESIATTQQNQGVAVEQEPHETATGSKAARAVRSQNVQGEESLLSPVEKARQATVSIETPWGTGSGFFIAKNYIVTNKHVVEFNTSDLKEIQEKIQTSRKIIDLEGQKIAELRKRMKKMPSGPDKSQLDIIINERMKYLEEITKQQEESEQRLAKLEKDAAVPQIKIVLSDGSEHLAGYIMVSSNYDLALLALFSHDGATLQKSGMPIRQGDKVYTIGSPVGLRNTVTAGVFSGYRQRDTDAQVFLQTDAAINPGNSGGPLIDERGFVHGVNTMILKDTEGIGFAIPIEKVFEEFGSTLL
jgi:S1-C subfamily serine protease